jgi:hypothetical protein
MNPVQRIALMIYLVFFIPALVLIYFVMAPFLAKLSGFNEQATTWSLLAMTVSGGAWAALSIIKDKNPLPRLGKILSARPNSGSSKISVDPVSGPKRDMDLGGK